MEELRQQGAAILPTVDPIKHPASMTPPVTFRLRHLRLKGQIAERDVDPHAAAKLEKRERREFLLRARSLTPYVAAGYRDLTFLVPTPSDGKLFVNGEASEFRILERAVSILRTAGRLPGSPTIVDVGAHVGTTTIPALAHHGFARAVAIEPDPENVRLLRANLALNGLMDRVTVLEAAASDTAGRRPFLRGARDEGAYRWKKGSLTDEPSPSALVVETITLDQLTVDGIVDPATTGLLWLDCQKHEEHVLRSASAFVDHRVPIVFALRPHLLAESSPLVVQLMDAYEQVVHLRRRAAGPESSWIPEIRPIEHLADLCRRRAATDVLVARGLDGPEGR
jgi:FkbM family methyltransferase